jgi:peptide/nickel transport system substrate-binding protein
MNDAPSFGLWLKQRRKELDLTQEKLAEQVGCAVSTIRKIEAGVLRPSRQIAERLANQLELPPEERAAFLKAARAAPRPLHAPHSAQEDDSEPSSVETASAPAEETRWRAARLWAAFGGVAVLAVLVLALASDVFRGFSAPTGAPTPTMATAQLIAVQSPASSPSLAASPVTPAAAATAEQVPAVGRGQGGTLRILHGRSPEALNSHQTNWSWDYDAARLIIEPLAVIDPDGALTPALAAEIPTIANGGVAKDFKSVTWKLKPDVTWSDGSPLTADDVVFTYTYCADKETGCTDGSTFEGAEKVEALDPTTMRISWKRPTPYPYRMFVGWNGYILQKRQFAACVGAKATTDAGCRRANLAPIGTGPYKLREITSDGTQIYDINERYRDSNRPFFKQVRIAAVADVAARAAAVFETGEADYAPYLIELDTATLKRMIEIGKGELLVKPTSYVERLLLNRANPDPKLGDKRSELDQPHPFLSDLRVRRALALALDRKAITEQVYRMGIPVSPSCELIVTEPYVSPKEIYGGRHSCGPDVDGARKLLDEAGWRPGIDGIRQKNGVRMKILFQTTIDPVRQKVQEMIKAAWVQLGVEVELTSVDADEFFAGKAGAPPVAAQFYADVEEFANGSDYDPTDYLCQWSSDQIARKSNNWSGNNYERFASAKYDLLCARLRVEPDPNKRKEIVLQMNDILVEDVAVIPLGTSGGDLFAAYSRRLKGIDLGAWDAQTWNIADWRMEP